MPVGVSFLPALKDVFKALEIHECRTMSLINHHGVFARAFTTAVFSVRSREGAGGLHAAPASGGTARALEPAGGKHAT